MTEVVKPYHLRELGAINIEKIKGIVSRASETVWNLEDAQKENDFDCFHDTRHIVFRFIEENRYHRDFYSNPNWTIWQSRLLPLLEQASRSYDFKEPVYPKVMLARLAAGAIIDRHTDGNAGSHPHTHKIHIPIITNEQARMFIRDRYFHLKEGCAYEVNNLVPHTVENFGATDRIHLIFEVFDQAQ